MRALVALLILTLGAFLLHFCLGSSGLLGLPDVVRELLRGPRGDTSANDIVWRLRLPRALGGLCVGGILGCVGSAFQALFRNPLAEPYVVGVSSGAAVGGAFALLIGAAPLLGGMGLLAFAFPGGLLSLALVFALARRRGTVDVTHLLLAGVVVGALLNALLTLVLLASGRDAGQVLRWLMGNTGSLTYRDCAVLGGALLVGGSLLMLQTRRLSAFALGEETARRLGVDVRRLKRATLGIGTAMIAASVGPVGVVGFVGLAAPHLARRLVGVDWRVSLPGATLLGAVGLLLADVLAQRAVPDHPLPVGVVTALLGAPFLLAVLRRAP